MDRKLKKNIKNETKGIELEMSEEKLSILQRIIFRINGYVHIRNKIYNNIKIPIYHLHCKKHGHYTTTITSTYFIPCPECLDEKR